MKLFTLHVPKNGADGLQNFERLVSVKDGFHWLAFVLPFPWLLVQRLWLYALLFLLATFIVMGLAGFLGLAPGFRVLLVLLLSLYVALEGGSLRALSLKKRGYKELAAIPARNREEAEWRFFAHHRRHAGE